MTPPVKPEQQKTAPYVDPVKEMTVLPPAMERQFQAWAKRNKITDVDDPASRYDYRGFFATRGPVPIRFGVDHFPDTYKQHGHPTFSIESQYSKGPKDGGRWDGEKFIPGPPPDSGAVFHLLMGLDGKPESKPKSAPSIVDAIRAYVQQLGEASHRVTSPGTASQMAAIRAVGLTPAPSQTAGPPGRPANSSLFDTAPQMSLHDLLGSAFADTLRAIAGTPSVTQLGNTGFRDAIGRYSGSPETADTLTLRPDALNRDAWAETPPGMDRSGTRVPEYILAHEMGHRYDAAHKFNTPVDSVRAANGAPTEGYASKGRGEHTAEAFANAIDFLRTTAQSRDGRSIADYERSVPGTVALVRSLLDLPIFAHHPINIANRMAAKPDATRVRR